MSLIQPYLAVMTDTSDDVVPTVKRFFSTLKEAIFWCDHEWTEEQFFYGRNDTWTVCQKMDDHNWRVFTITKVI